MSVWARGPWGPLGPRCRIRVETVTTYCQAGFQPYETCTQQPHTCTQTFPHTDYLLSGKATYCQAKLPTVRQSYLLSGRLSAVMKLAPNNRILCTQTSPQTCTQQPHTCTQPIHRHAPKRHRHAPKRLHILCTQQPYTFASNSF